MKSTKYLRFSQLFRDSGIMTVQNQKFFILKKSCANAICEGNPICFFRCYFHFRSTGKRSDMSNSRYFSQLNSVKTAKLSRRNHIFKNYIFLLGNDKCALVTRSCQKVVKKWSNRLQNVAFWKFLVNVNCLNNFWKSKFQMFLKRLKSGCSDVQRGRYLSRKSCVTRTEFSRETMFCKITFFVLRND